MTLKNFLEFRRKELIDFFDWRFGTRFWVEPLCYVTRLNPAFAIKLRRCGVGVDPGDLTADDIQKAEEAALHLGFRPHHPKSKRRPSYHIPPKPSLPYSCHREMKKRYRKWIMQPKPPPPDIDIFLVACAVLCYCKAYDYEIAQANERAKLASIYL